MTLVSIIIVARNAQNNIENCLKSCLQQFEGWNIDWEIIVVDGNASDDTVSVSQKILGDRYNATILPNPKQTLAAGWNLGIIAAKGEYVARPDAHGGFGQRYIRTAVELLSKNSNFAAVGGILETRATGWWGGIIASSLSSKVGVGNSSFRTGGSRGPQDTVVYGVYRKTLFEEVGLFNEALTRNQDNDIHSRILLSGYTLFFEPNISAFYMPRSTPIKLARQLFLNGYFMKDLKWSQLSIRHLIPGAFVCGIIGGSLLGIVWPVFKGLLLFVLLVYGIIVACDTIIRVLREKRIKLLLSVALIPIMHLAYGAGFWSGQFTRLFAAKFRFNNL
ncbi:MAG: glycosyltransferase family 2 protein [bacterium]|nr:glycosyltransferase family 2 protein [bacterium]